MSCLEVTQTGQPGPDTRLRFSGSKVRRPCRKMATVCVPQSSIKFHRRVVALVQEHHIETIVYVGYYRMGWGWVGYNDHIQYIMDEIKNFCDENGCILIDTQALFEAAQQEEGWDPCHHDWIGGDCIHPNPDGSRAIAEAIMAQVDFPTGSP